MATITQKFLIFGANMRFLVLLLLFCGQIFAFNAEYKSFSSDFTQKIRSMNSTINYTGNFVITQKEAFWNYKSPAKKQIFINNTQVVVLEPDLAQATYSKLSDTPNLTQIFKQAKKIAIDKYEAKYQKITYTITIVGNEVKSIAYKDELDNDVIITLQNQRRNVPINKAIFTPKIPPNFDIVR